jgi:hypothetical protein
MRKSAQRLPLTGLIRIYEPQSKFWLEKHNYLTRVFINLHTDRIYIKVQFDKQWLVVWIVSHEKGKNVLKVNTRRKNYKC